MRIPECGGAAREAVHDADHVLEPIPLGHLHDERDVGGGGGPARKSIRAVVDPARRAVAVGEDRGNLGPAAQDAHAEEDQRTVRASMGAFFTENGSMDGGMTT